MKPVDFHLHRPRTLDEALMLLAEHGEDGKVLAGGQSLVPLLNFRLARPEHVIDLTRITSLATIHRTGELLTVGAMVTQAQAERSQAVAQTAPLMRKALPHIAHPAIRARGTVGGSLAHGDPAAELPAVAIALDATMVALSTRGQRTIEAREFFLGNLVSVLRPDEILTEIRIPVCSGGTGAAFTEVARRQGDFALVGAGAQVRLSDAGEFEDVRIGVTGVSPKPHRAHETEDALKGQRPRPDRIRAAAEAAGDALAPSGDLHATADYRRHVATTLISRAVETATHKATARGAA